MKIAPRPVLVLHEDRDLRHRIRSAARTGYAYRALQGWESLRDAIRDAPPSAVVVVDPYANDSLGGIAPELYGLLADFPSVPVIAAFDVTVERMRDVVYLADVGVVDVIARGHDDSPEALEPRLRAATGRTLKARVDRILPPGLDGRVRALLDTAAEIASEGGNAVVLARRLELSKRTLLRWTLDARMPPPRRLLAWMRILLAALLLDDRGRTVSGVALACGYSSDSSLRRTTMQFLGRPPSRMRHAGAVAMASRAFLAELEACRSARPGGA